MMLPPIGIKNPHCAKIIFKMPKLLFRSPPNIPGGRGGVRYHRKDKEERNKDENKRNIK